MTKTIYTQELIKKSRNKKNEVRLIITETQKHMWIVLISTFIQVFALANKIVASFSNIYSYYYFNIISFYFDLTFFAENLIIR